MNACHLRDALLSKLQISTCVNDGQRDTPSHRNTRTHLKIITKKKTKKNTRKNTKKIERNNERRKEKVRKKERKKERKNQCKKKTKKKNVRKKEQKEKNRKTSPIGQRCVLQVFIIFEYVYISWM